MADWRSMHLLCCKSTHQHSQSTVSVMIQAIIPQECSLERDDFIFESSSPSSLLMEHDLFRKPVSTFRDYALTARTGQGEATHATQRTGEFRRRIDLLPRLWCARGNADPADAWRQLFRFLRLDWCCRS